MFRNIASNWVVTVLIIVVTFVLTPFVLHTLGEEAYGTYLLISSIIGYLPLLLFGVPVASVRSFAEHVAEGSQTKLNQAIGTCAGLYLMMGATALLAGAGLFVFFKWKYDIPLALAFETRLTFLLVLLNVPAVFFQNIPQGVMAAHHDFLRRNLVLAGSLLLRLSLTLTILTFIPSMVVVAFIQIVCVIFDSWMCWLLIRRRSASTRMSPLDFDWNMMREIFSFSMYVMLLHAGYRLVFQTDSMVIGAWLCVNYIPFYAVANSLVLYIMDFTGSIGDVIMPTATKLKTQGRAFEIGEVFLRWSKVAFSLTMMAGLFLIVLGPRFIGWWIGPSFEGPSGEILQILMISCLFFLPVMGVASPMLMGLGKPVLLSVSFLATGLLNLGMSLYLIRHMGLVGVALGTAIPNILFALVVLVVTCHELKISLLKYFQYALLRTVIGTLPILGLLLWLDGDPGLRSFFELFTAGCAMVLLFGLISVFFVYRNDPYLDLKRKLLKLLQEDTLPLKSIAVKFLD